jgi:Uma2 family endonuclease
MATVTETNMANQTLTAEAYGAMGDLGRPTELIKGRIIEMNVPYPRHGLVCAEAAFLLSTYIKQHQLGRIVTNDSGVKTEQDPDSVRGADVAYYSYARVPKGSFPLRGYLEVCPDLVVEVRSPGDRWALINAKIAEYLGAGVGVVLVLDHESETAQVHYPDKAPRMLSRDDRLTLPEVLGDFSAVVSQFFE